MEEGLESRSDFFAKGVNIYKILIIGYVGNFLGVLIEMLWCLLTRGRIESRAGLVYGPFSLLYGAGAVAMTLALFRWTQRLDMIEPANAFLAFIDTRFSNERMEYIFPNMVFG